MTQAPLSHAEVKISNADRPDPVSGRRASVAYAEMFASSHRNIADEVKYRASYSDILILDRMFSDYRFLDIGCGTGGYLHLCENHAAITAIDFSETMIDQAHKLKEELGMKRVSFVCESFESFHVDQQFDIVRMGGAVGIYKPWPGNEYAFEKAREFVRVGGIVLATCIRPRTLLDIIKTNMVPSKTVVISTSKLGTLAAGYGFETLFTIDYPTKSTRLFMKRIK